MKIKHYELSDEAWNYFYLHKFVRGFEMIDRNKIKKELKNTEMEKEKINKIVQALTQLVNTVVDKAIMQNELINKMIERNKATEKIIEQNEVISKIIEQNELTDTMIERNDLIASMIDRNKLVASMIDRNKLIDSMIERNKLTSSMIDRNKLVTDNFLQGKKISRQLKKSGANEAQINNLTYNLQAIVSLIVHSIPKSDWHD